MTITEKTAYLKGLAEGLEIDFTTKEGKLLKAIIDVIDDLASSVTGLESECEDLYGYIEEIDEDLGLLESDCYPEDSCYDDDDDDDDDEFDDAEYAVECPSCGENIYVDEDIAEKGEVDCPNCGENLEFSFDEDCECCCCDDDGHDGEDD